MLRSETFNYRLRNGSQLEVTAEGIPYRDEYGQAWINSFMIGFMLLPTPNYDGAVEALRADLGMVKNEAEERLVELFDQDTGHKGRETK